MARKVSDNSVSQFTKLKPKSSGPTTSDNSVFQNRGTVSRGRSTSDNSVFTAEKQAHDQRQFRESQIIAQQRQEQGENARREREENYNQEERSSAKEKTYEGNKEYSTSTGNYERGGYVVQETRGDSETLKTLGKQQPGSSLVQNEGGEYLLIRSTGLNLGNEATLNKLNENIALEGGSKYYPTERKNSKGGTDHFIRLKESLGLSEEISGYTSSPSIETSKAYHVDLSETITTKPEYQKTRKAQPREIAEMISSGELPNLFIGPQGADILNLEKEYASTQKFKPKEILPLTFTDKSGKELFTITEEHGGKFSYSVRDKEKENSLNKLINNKEVKPEANKIFPFPLESNPAKPDLLKTAGQTYLNTGIDIVTTLPILGFGVVKNPISDKLSEYRKETPSDILFRPERYSEIPAQLSKPEFQVSTLALASTLIIPTKVPRIPRFAFQSTRSKVSQLETEFLREPGIVSGSEKLGKGTYLISKGTESKPALVPLTVVKKSPKGELGAYEITPEPRILYPKEINVQGSLFPKFKKELEVKQIGKYSFKAENPSLEAKQTFRMGVETEGIVPIAEVRHAPVKSILEGKSSELYEYSKSTKGVYAQTRAETKFNPPKNPLVPSSIIYQKGKPFDYDLINVFTPIGAGQAGRGFTPQQTKTIKTFVRAEAKQAEKPRQDFLGNIHSPTYLQSQSAESLFIQYPEGTSDQITKLKGRTIQQEGSLQIPRLSTRLEGASILEQGTKLQTKTVQKTQLKTQLRTELLPRLDIIPRQATRTRLAQTPRLLQRQVQRFKLITIPEIPIIPKEKIKVPLLFFSNQTPRLKKGRSKESEKGSRLDFLGNVPLSSIIGVYKRKEITYSGISSLLAKERRGGKSKRRKAKKKSNKGIGISFF